jgi:hypothetical protein
MIAQIYNHFTVDNIFLWLNLGVLPFWIVLIFFSRSKICKILTTSIFPFFILSLIYLYLIYSFFNNDYNFSKNFNLYLGLSHLLNLLENPSFTILFWIHFLSINLFCGGWVVKDSEKLNIPKFLVFFPLILIYLIGPVGLFLYWFIKIFFAKKISFYD